MERYKHTVFFEVHNLLDVHLKHIERYFQIRRRSGGGECEILKVGANTYKICFKDKEAKERVLAQKDHAISLSEQDRICISLSSDDVAESEKQPKESDQKMCAKAKDMEKVFKLDPYLIRYLSECTNANADLKQRLSKLSSSFQIRIDSEELVVVKDQVSQESCPLKKWHFEIEEVLTDIQNYYVLYFEIEKSRLEFLQENTFLFNENVILYHEKTFAVVVGECEKVEKIAKFVDALQVKQQDEREYKRNNENVYQSLPLSMPEIAEHISEILSFIGVKKSIVKVNPTCSPSPCVHLQGPRCEVEGLKKNLDSSLKRLVIKQYEVNGPGVQQFFQGDGMDTLKSAKKSHDVQILPIDRAQQSGRVPTDASTSASPQSLLVTNCNSEPMEVDYVDKDVHIKIVIGSLEEQQADVFVASMLKTNLTSTTIGSCLLKKGGQQFQNYFDNAKKKGTLMPGDVLEVDGTSTLGCSKVFFIECVPKSGIQSVKALHSGLARVLTLCKQQSCGSVALPIIGPGLLLSIPVKDAIYILAKEITTFLSGFTGALHTIYITIMPDDTHSEEMFEKVYTELSAKMVDSTGKALFQSLTSDLDEIVIAISGTQVHLVLGDITNETSDVIVNSTDFTTTDFQTGVCKDILTKAGPQIQAQLTGAKVQTGEIFKTPPGSFPCKQIMHLCGQRSASLIETLAKDIVVHCERDHYRSVAIPAICAGKGCMDPKEVAKSILQGVKNGIQGANLQFLKTVRILLLKINVFLAFKEIAPHILGNNTQLSVPAPLVPISITTRGRSATTRGQSATTTRASRSQFSPVGFDISLLTLPVTQSKAEFLVIGHTTDDVSNACTALKMGYENQCASHCISYEDLKCLNDVEMNQIASKVQSLHLQMKERSSGVYEVIGHKDRVTEVSGLVQGALRRQVRQKDQDSLYVRVTWCILGQQGLWQKLSKEMNYKLEERDVRDGIIDAQGVKWTVDLTKMEATACGTRQKTKLKRLENRSDFSLPIYWDNMTSDKLLRVNLDQSSAEYKSVKADFKKTVKQTVLKIERIQNVNLRRLYEVRKNELENRNDPDGADEKLLYHGTSEGACLSIMDSSFNRRYAGQNGTLCGEGTYFAVSASYSANTMFSTPKSDGTQLMFVARVLTGRYTQGNGSLKAAPDNFDSVVDDTQNPTMFVVFHDCQAYPDYLITFK